MEQQIITDTIVKLDFIDSLKLLFGRVLKVKTTICIPQENEIQRFNACASISIEKTTIHFVKQDKPNYGYSERVKTPPEVFE